MTLTWWPWDDLADDLSDDLLKNHPLILNQLCWPLDDLTDDLLDDLYPMEFSVWYCRGQFAAPQVVINEWSLTAMNKLKDPICVAYRQWCKNSFLFSIAIAILYVRVLAGFWCAENDRDANLMLNITVCRYRSMLPGAMAPNALVTSFKIPLGHARREENLLSFPVSRPTHGQNHRLKNFSHTF